MDEIQAILDRIGTEDPPTAEELKAAKAQLTELMRAEGALPNADLEVLKAYKDAYDTVAGAITEAETREAEVKAAVDELLADLDEGGEGDQPEGEGDEPEQEGEGDEGVEGKETKVPVAAGAGVRVLGLKEAAARVKERPAPPAPTPKPSGLKQYLLGREQVTPITMDTIVKQFDDLTRGGSAPAGKHNVVRYETVAHNGWTDLKHVDDIGKRTAMLDAVVSPEAVAAAGGCCILPEPIREQTVLSSTATPIRDSLPSFGVTTTGAVTFYPPVCFPQDGAAVWTCDDDAAVDPDDPDTWKVCAAFECDEAVVTDIDAIYHCITIGEFQRRFDSERWRAVLQTLLASEARLIETHLFSKMRAATTANWVAGNTGSVLVTMIQALGVASEIMRQDQRLTDINLRWWAPSWLRQANRADMVARRIVHIDNPVMADQLLTTALSNVGVNVTWTGDVDIIDTPPITGGPLGADLYPAFAHTVLAPEGYYTYLDGGQFDLGTEIRDFNLARQNAVAAFAEQFQGLMARGCAAYGIDLPVAVCDLADGCLPLS